MNGGWIFFASSLCQSMCFEKNGCLLISSAPFAPSRFAGSLCSSPVISVIASCGMSCGNSSGSDRMRWYITFTSSS